MYDVVNVSTQSVEETWDTPQAAAARVVALRAEGKRVRIRKRGETPPDTEEQCLACRCRTCLQHGPLVFSSPVPRSVAGLAVVEGTTWVIPASGAEWRLREAALASLVDNRMPWCDEPWWQDSPLWLLHYPRVSSEDPEQLAFTPSEEWGRQDRQLRMRPGKYLRRYFGEVLTEEQIAAWAQQYTKAHSEAVFHLATTEEDIEEVYCNGPSSCMAHEPGEYESPCHPVRVYAAGDLAVGYLGARRRATARSVVWPAKKRYTTIYGDAERLAPALQRAGYTRGSLEGARLLRKETESGQFVVPYLDSAGMVDDDGEFLVIRSHGGTYEATDTNGLTSRPRPQCDRCHERYDDEDDGVYIECRDETWCPSCAEDTTWVGCCETRIPDDDARMLPNGDWVCDDHWSECATECEGCGDEIMRDDVYIGPDDVERCEECHNEAVAECESCGEAVLASDTHEGPDGTKRCATCHEAEVIDCPECGEAVLVEEATNENGTWRCAPCYEQLRLQLEEVDQHAA